jgi:hypothetical protein
MIYKQRLYVCACGNTLAILRWDIDPPPVCGTCNKSMDEQGSVALGRAPGVIGDTIPGGLMIRHGLCHDDGTPRRYDSMTEIRREAARRGYTIHGETPNAPNCDGHVEIDRDR